MSGLKGELVAEVEVKSPADEVYDIFKGKMHHLPGKCSKRIQDVKVHHGDWHLDGSIKNWTYVVAVDGKVESGKEKVTIDDEKKTVRMVFFEGDPMKDYKVYNVVIQVIPKGEGGVVKWTLEYERRSESIPPPHRYLDFVTKLTKDLDASLLSAA
ncbi:MLP-like protein 28 [Malania oleifera]|uniref:MLP-like protein 28 n=1 Tax=Malania oleifera TaxID=397392 RepID=UPI0025ADBB7F|nr:MLP-like protein 28 [Malania oleifera]